MQVCTDIDMVTHLGRHICFLTVERHEEGTGLGTGGFARWPICMCIVQEYKEYRKTPGNVSSPLIQ